MAITYKLGLFAIAKSRAFSVMFQSLEHWLSNKIIHYLETPTYRYAPFFAPKFDVLRRALEPGDVLLVEGNTRLSAVIKFLTQSSWSHAALYLGDAGIDGRSASDPETGLLEAHAQDGVVRVPLAKYAHFNTRICRPVGLSAEERQKVIAYAVARLGMQYDSRQIVDLARYLFPYPPVPVFLRRRLLAIGSGDPTRAICSTLIAEAFGSIRYPILPESVEGAPYGIAPYVQGETEHIRKHGLFTPRDFDISPYFAVIKPTIDDKFDYHNLEWAPSAPMAKSAP